MDNKLELRSDIMERLDDTVYAIQQAKEDFSDYELDTLKESELRAMLSEAATMQDFVGRKAGAMLGILEEDGNKLDAITMRLQATHMLLEDCKARLYGCLDVLYNLPMDCEIPNLAEIDTQSKELRAKVQELYNAELGKLLATVRVLP